MSLNLASAIYGAVAASRRRWYGRDPERRRRLTRPVVSVGNLRVGGAGKTPIVACLARMLRDAGQRPAILTRGYARRQAADGVTVVSDTAAVLVGVSQAGDEPLMLARALPGVPVLVGPDRYLSGRLAERRFDATVLILDDGFQHLELTRDVDLLLMDEGDLSDRSLPVGSLREPLAAASVADAVLVNARSVAAAECVGRAVGVSRVFQTTRALGAPRMISVGDSVLVPTGGRAFAVAGIAQPKRFFEDLAACGWIVVGTMGFRDHHPFGPDEVRRIAAAAKAADAQIVLTTEKDAVRLEGYDLGGVPTAAVPLAAGVEPAAEFRAWLLGVLERTSRTRSNLLNPLNSLNL